MPYVQRDFANVILYVAFRQQDLVGIAFGIDTYVIQLLVFEVEDSWKQKMDIQRLTLSPVGPNAGLSRVPELNPHPTSVIR